MALIPVPATEFFSSGPRLYVTIFQQDQDDMSLKLTHPASLDVVDSH
jgi:hypothetical protein